MVETAELNQEELELSSEEGQKEQKEIEATAPFVPLHRDDLPAIFEAFIFASSEPLTLPMLKECLEGQGYEFTKAEIKEALNRTLEKWNNPERVNGQGLELVQLAGGYIFRTNPKWGFVVRALLKEKPQKLSPSQLEVLAMVAYRQPVTRIEIEEIRGVDSSAAMRRLLNLKLIKILGKSEGLGRPLLYGTTKHFLELFGLNSLHDLPTLKEYKELGKGADLSKEEANKDLSGTIVDLFADAKDQMFSDDTEKLSQEALESLEKALGAVVSTAKKLDIDKTLNGDVEN